MPAGIQCCYNIVTNASRNTVLLQHCHQCQQEHSVVTTLSPVSAGTQCYNIVTSVSRNTVLQHCHQCQLEHSVVTTLSPMLAGTQCHYNIVTNASWNTVLLQHCHQCQQEHSVTTLSPVSAGRQCYNIVNIAGTLIQYVV